MNGSKIFLDTNIVLYLLNGDETLATFLNNKQLYISFITQLELLGYHGLTERELNMIKQFITECKIIDVNTSIKETTIEIRRKYQTKLPDSIISASAIYLDLPLITADKGFAKIEELECVSYEVD